MADNFFSIARGATGPALRIKLTGIAEIPAGSPVKFRMPPVFTEREAIVISYSSPEIEYQWQAGDTDILGTFPGSVVIESTNEVVPSDSVIPIRVVDHGA